MKNEMNRLYKINKTVLVMMTLAAVAIAFKNALPPGHKGYLPWSGARPRFHLIMVKHRRWQFPVYSQ